MLSDSHSSTTPRWAQWLAAAAWLAVILLFWLHRDRLTLEGILNFTPKNTALAVLVLLALFALKSVSVVMYSGILYGAAGILFPLPLAIGVNILGTAIMVTIPYVFGRHLGADAVDRITAAHPKAAMLRQIRGRNEFLFTFIIRVINLLSLDVVSAYLGATRTHFTPYFLGSVLGMLPPCVLFPVLGDNITDPDSPQFLAAAGIELAIMAVSLLATALLRRRQRHA